MNSLYVADETANLSTPVNCCAHGCLLINEVYTDDSCPTSLLYERLVRAMPFSYIIGLMRGGTITMTEDLFGHLTVVYTMSSGPALDAVLSSAEKSFHANSPSIYDLSPALLGELRELRQQHGDTLTKELSNDIDNKFSNLVRQVRIEPNPFRIFVGSTLKLFFKHEDVAFYSDKVSELQYIL